MPPYCLRNLNDELGVEFRVLLLASNSIDRIATRIAQYPALPEHVIKRIVGMTMNPIVSLLHQRIEVAGKRTRCQFLLVLLGHLLHRWQMMGDDHCLAGKRCCQLTLQVLNGRQMQFDAFSGRHPARTAKSNSVKVSDAPF